jgi:hypothetical protein
MSDDTGPQRPNALQYITYCYGRVLPDSMQAWVRHDLTGKGAMMRTIVRVTLPALLLLAPLWLIPTTVYMHLAMTLLLLVPFLYFAHALNKIWRRHRLLQHGMNPDLVDELARKRDAHIHRAYEERYGPRPE